jgi:hypothetical protein
MLAAIVRPSPTIRSAVIIAASVALLLPLPVRCLSCSHGDADCARCHAAHSATTQPAHRSCCQHRAGANRIAAPPAACPSHAQSRTCGCKLELPDRTYVTSEGQTVPADLVAILPAVQPLFATDPSHADSATASCGDLPPPVPHRILHCSWII